MSDNHETWLLDEGDRVIARKAAVGYAALPSLERLIHCLWSADYGMRNAGDLAAAADVHPPFLHDAGAAARELGLTRCAAAFALPSAELEQRYFHLFDGMVAEVRAVRTSGGRGVAT